jgi:heptosyltransferase II
MTGNSLIVKLGAIGDVASVLPAAWMLHQSGSQVQWLCGKSVVPLLSCYSWIHVVAIDDGVIFGKSLGRAFWHIVRAWIRLTRISYDSCAILQYNPHYGLLALPVTAQRRLILRRDSRPTFLISERHHSAEYARILCDLPDSYSDCNVAPLFPDNLPRNPLPCGGRIRIALAPGGARNLLRDDPQRRWSITSYVELARLLINEGFEVVLTGSMSDRWIEPYFRTVKARNCIAQWTIPELLAFYDSCDCVITHDTGPLHLAGLVRCRLIGLFGPTVPSKALPRRTGVVALWGGERLPCRPCYDGHAFAPCSRNECMISITPERVLSEVLLLIKNSDPEWRIETI